MPTGRCRAAVRYRPPGSMPRPHFIIPSIEVCGAPASNTNGASADEQNNKIRRPECVGGRGLPEGNMRLRLDSQGHARLIESTVNGIAEATTIGQVVRRSWSRCLSTYSLDPQQVKKPVIV